MPNWLLVVVYFVCRLVGWFYPPLREAVKWVGVNYALSQLKDRESFVLRDGTTEIEVPPPKRKPEKKPPPSET